ncbi:unnamed protein product [Blepharisma stoltei]|uniref:Glutathione S-transferase n=1 Tax=Blepharisma stoltei TaxID=1481888 RepID=A0AAU9JMQ7_9CILI|nr:unnamed protein product [Blepharisma stoltei]
MSKINLHYFDIYGDGECIRTILTYFDIPFNDHRISVEEWKNLKSQGFSEFDLLPALDIDGLRLVDTESICNYIARKYEFYPKNFIDTYLVDSICEYRKFILGSFTEILIGDDLPGWERFIHEKMPYFLRKFEARLEKNNGGFTYFVDVSITMADFMIFDIIYNFCLRPGKIEKFGNIVDINAPKCKTLCERIINSSDRFREYLKNRPYRKF